jgi:GntR family transcriptional regulator
MSHLKLSLALTDPKPIFKQIVDSVRVLIASGELAPGSKLPSVRALAMEQTISVNTVAKAYNILTAQGLVISKPGLGLFVGERRQLLSESEQQKKLDFAVSNFVSDVSDLHIEQSVIIDKVKNSLSKLGPVSTDSSPSNQEKN